MKNQNSLAVFENFKIRRIYDEKKEMWYFSVVDIIQALIQQTDYQTARKYWNKLKERLKQEGNESVTNCHQLKAEGSQLVTNCDQLKFVATTGASVITEENFLPKSKT